MKGDETREEHLARLLQSPRYAAAHAVGRPFSNLALNVWSLRETKEMTQLQLAEAAKLRQPGIAGIERDEANPTLLTISRVAFALGVTASELLAEPDKARLAKARALVEIRVRMSPSPRLAPPKRRKQLVSGGTESHDARG